jgi:hypothetical protein
MELPRRQFLRMATAVAALPAVSHMARAQAYPSPSEADIEQDLWHTALSLDCLCFASPGCDDGENSHA